MIEVDYNEYKKTIADNMKLIVENHNLKEEIERLQKDLTYYQKYSADLLNKNNTFESIINELEKALKDNIDMCDGFIDTATTDLQELGARYNGKTYYQTILLENKIALKIYQKELNKLQELKGSNDPSYEEMVEFVENVCKDIKNQSTLHEELEEERKTIAKIVGDFKEVIKSE